MYAVEFQTQITNGEIQLPNEWKGKLSGLVRIIVLTETEPSYRNGADFWPLTSRPGSTIRARPPRAVGLLA